MQTEAQYKWIYEFLHKITLEIIYMDLANKKNI